MMKKLFLLACLAIFGLSSCLGQFAKVQNGDLLFVGLPLDYTIFEDTTMESAIAASTGKNNHINYIHVAILEVDQAGQIWIIDATIKHGVDRHPLDTFLSDFTLKDGSYPILDVKRLKKNQDAALYVENAKKYCGRGYDIYFLPDNNEKYCSELVRDAYITPAGKHLFNEKPMNFKSKDGTFPPYWVQLFGLINQPIPQGLPGTNPNAMSKEKVLKEVGSLNVKPQ